MQEHSNHLPLLIVDPDPLFIATILSDSVSIMNPPVIALSSAEAQTKLANTLKPFAGIFVNSVLPDSSGLAVVKSALEKHVGTPTFLIYNEQSPAIDPEELKRVAVHDSLKKPVTFAQMMSLVTPLLKGFELPPLEEEQITPGTEFIPIRAVNFISGKKSFFDLYVRIRDDKFLKLLTAGEPFPPDRLEKYLERGIKNFYLRKEARGAYVSYCDHLATALLEQNKAPIELRTTQIYNQGEETLKFLRESGVSENKLRFATSFVENTQELVKQLRLERDFVIERYLQDALAFEHGVAVSMLVSLLMSPLKIESERLQQTIGLAALMHDIGLYQAFPNMQIEAPTNMSEEQLKLYQGHPGAGARMLYDINGVDGVVIQAIAQHHERRDGKGFPLQLGASRISRVAEMIGIADEFVQLMLRTKNEATLHPMYEMHTRVFDKFSSDIVDAFCMAFLRPDIRKKRQR